MSFFSPNDLPKENESVEILVGRSKTKTIYPKSSDGFNRGFLLKYFYDKEKGLCFMFSTENGIFNLPASDHSPYFLTDSQEEAGNTNRPYEPIVKHDNKLDVDKTFYKILCKHPTEVPRIRALCSSTYEDRIDYYHCYLTDKHIYPTMPYSYNGDKLKEDFTFDIDDKFYGHFFNARIKKEDYLKDLKKYDIMRHFFTLLTTPTPDLPSFAIDIEVTIPEEESVEEAMKEENVINTASIYSDSPDAIVEKVVYTTRLGELKKGDYIRCNSEKELLLKFFYQVELLVLTNPILLSFNGNRFDLPKINQRAKVLGILDRSPFILNEEKNYTIKNGVHIDLWTWFSKGSVKTYVYDNKYIYNSLENISFNLLGKHKGQVDFNNASANGMCEYCLLDSQLTYELFEYKDRLVFSIICLLSRWGQVPIEQVVNNSIGFWMKTIFYSLHRDLNIVIPKPSGDQPKHYKGALTVEPEPNTYFDVKVLDYASLYPSIIDVSNVSYDTVQKCSHQTCEYAEEIGVRVCNKTRGIFSLLIGSIRELRVKIFKPLGKDNSFFFAISSFLKVLANASYGVTGDSDQPSLYTLAVAEFVTWKARQSITKLIQKCNEIGLQVLAGDTDSVFIHHPTQDQIDFLIKWVFDTMNMDLELDKDLKFLVIPQLKKNYLAVYRDGTYKVAGMVGKKIHIPSYIKSKFTECIKEITKSNTQEELEQSKMKVLEIYIDGVKSLVKGSVHLNDLAYYMTPSFDPATKVKKGSHSQLYQVCKYLLDRNIRVEGGSPVAFIKSKKPSALPLQFAKPSDVDVENYVSCFESVFSQLFEPLGLTVPNVNESKLEEFF